MALSMLNLPKLELAYPQITVDGTYGAVISTQLFRTQFINAYELQFVEGTFVGGTSPAWAISGTAPVITHVSLTVDNETIFDADYQMIANYEQLISGKTPDGEAFTVRISDINFSQGKAEIEITGLPSWKFNQIIMLLTINSLANITTGAPTGTSGSAIQLVERGSPRASAQGVTPVVVKHLQVAQTLPITGINDLTQYLSQDGKYKDVFLYVDTGTAYAAPSDTAVSRLKLVINSTTTVKDSYWQAMKAAARAITGQLPGTGYNLISFMPDNTPSKLLALNNVQAITNVDLQATTTVGTARMVAFKVEYF